MRSGLNILNIGLIAVLFVAAMSVHARAWVPESEPINLRASKQMLFVR